MGNCLATKQTDSRSPKRRNIPPSPKKLQKEGDSIKETGIFITEPEEVVVSSHEDINKIYLFRETIGHGHFGSVRLALNRKNLTEQYAVKTIAKEKLSSEIGVFKRELEILQQLDHPNVIRFYEVYEDPKYFHIVMELCTGGELFEEIVKKGHFSEKEAAGVVHQIASAINHMHELKICHRDLKPENFLFSTEETHTIKVIDFGLACKFAAAKEMSTIVGTPYYVAPEVLRGTYTESCDIWSLGVMIFVILGGYPPFNGESHKEIFDSILNDELPLDQPEFDDVSDDAIDLIKRMVVKDPTKRLTATQVLHHPWFAKWEEEHTYQKLNPSIFNGLHDYHVERKLRREALLLMVKLFKEEEIHDLKEAFSTIDKDQTGMISLEELDQALRGAGHEIALEELKKIFSEIDLNKCGKILYSEFLAATLNTQNHLTQEHLWQVFRHFDVDNTDYITEENLMNAMGRAGKPVGEDEVKLMIEEADFTKDGRISFQEFCKMFQVSV